MTGLKPPRLGKKLAILIRSDLISVDCKSEGEQEIVEEESVVANFKLVPVGGGTEQKRAKTCSST